MRVVKRGFDEVREVVPGPVTEAKAEGKRNGSKLPVMVKQLPQSKAP